MGASHQRLMSRPGALPWLLLDGLAAGVAKAQPSGINSVKLSRADRAALGEFQLPHAVMISDSEDLQSAPSSRHTTSMHELVL